MRSFDQVQHGITHRRLEDETSSGYDDDLSLLDTLTSYMSESSASLNGAFGVGTPFYFNAPASRLRPSSIIGAHFTSNTSDTIYARDTASMESTHTSSDCLLSAEGPFAAQFEDPSALYPMRLDGRPLRDSAGISPNEQSFPLLPAMNLPSHYGPAAKSGPSVTSLACDNSVNLKLETVVDSGLAGSDGYVHPSFPDLHLLQLQKPRQLQSTPQLWWTQVLDTTSHPSLDQTFQSSSNHHSQLFVSQHFSDAANVTDRPQYAEHTQPIADQRRCEVPVITSTSFPFIRANNGHNFTHNKFLPASQWPRDENANAAMDQESKAFLDPKQRDYTSLVQDASAVKLPDEEMGSARSDFLDAVQSSTPSWCFTVGNSGMRNTGAINSDPEALVKLRRRRNQKNSSSKRSRLRKKEEMERLRRQVQDLEAVNMNELNEEINRLESEHGQLEEYLRTVLQQLPQILREMFLPNLEQLLSIDPGMALSFKEVYRLKTIPLSNSLHHMIAEKARSLLSQSCTWEQLYQKQKNPSFTTTLTSSQLRSATTSQESKVDSKSSASEIVSASSTQHLHTVSEHFPPDEANPACKTSRPPGASQGIPCPIKSGDKIRGQAEVCIAEDTGILTMYTTMEFDYSMARVVEWMDFDQDRDIFSKGVGYAKINCARFDYNTILSYLRIRRQMLESDCYFVATRQKTPEKCVYVFQTVDHEDLPLPGVCSLLSTVPFASQSASSSISPSSRDNPFFNAQDANADGVGQNATSGGDVNGTQSSAPETAVPDNLNLCLVEYQQINVFSGPEPGSCFSQTLRVVQFASKLPQSKCTAGVPRVTVSGDDQGTSWRDNSSTTHGQPVTDKNILDGLANNFVTTSFPELLREWAGRLESSPT